MSPGRTRAWTAILFEVEVPFVPKNSSLHPNALAAFSWATLMLPVGSSSESKPPDVAEDSARKMLTPYKWPKARIQQELKIDVPRPISRACQRIHAGRATPASTI